MLDLIAAVLVGAAASFYAAPTHALIAHRLYPLTACLGGHRPESFVLPCAALLVSQASLVAFLVLAAAKWVS